MKGPQGLCRQVLPAKQIDPEDKTHYGSFEMSATSRPTTRHYTHNTGIFTKALVTTSHTNLKFLLLCHYNNQP
jgi:hypothetical protein